MPIEITDTDKLEFECIQDSARVSIDYCDKLPIVDKKDGYAGMAGKIKNLIKSKQNLEIESEKEISIVGVGDEINFDQNEYQKSFDHTKTDKIRKNITYRRFHFGNRHTIRKL